MNTRALHSELTSTPGRAPERRAGLTLTLAALVGIGAAALTGCASQTTELTAPPTATASETGTPSPDASSAPERELTAEAWEIPGTLTPEEAATLLVDDRLSEWVMTGATQETIDGYLDAGGSSSYTRSIAETNATVIADALFVPGWRGDDALAHYVDFETEQNAANVEAWILTSGSGLPQDREPYERGILVNSTTVESVEGDTAHVIVAATEFDNADRNSVGVGERISRTPEQVIDGDMISGDITLRMVDGAWKVAAISWSARE